ncbi:MAG TPA: class I SAM-dependent methyltransferase [Rubrivivax sp.]
MATDGEGYELTMGRWSRRLAQPFLDFIGPGCTGRVLDVGCGTGHLAGAIASRSASAQVQAVDLSPVYVAAAKRQYANEQVQFEVGDACALTFPDRAFDCVLSMLLLHFVPDTARALAQMRRVARTGATVGAAVWDVRGGFVANRMFFDTAAALDAKAGERRARNYTRPMTRPGELAAAWKSVGFIDVAETLISIRMEFGSFADYWAPYIGKEGPAAEYVGSLSSDERERLAAAVRAAYLDGEPDGPRSYGASAWAVRGVVA